MNIFDIDVMRRISAYLEEPNLRNNMIPVSFFVTKNLRNLQSIYISRYPILLGSKVVRR